MLIKGVWQDKWQPVQKSDEQGRFIRQTSSFRHWITPDGSPGPAGDGGFKAEAGRYHLYVAYICPWASRTLMVRGLKGLQDLVSVTVVNPRLSDHGWQFGGYPGAKLDPVNNANYMHELYTRANSQYTGRATVPVLWDKQTGTIVNNESADILRMFNCAFNDLVDQGPDLYPADIAGDIDALNQHIYRNLNNGVYQAGFASTQQAYKEAYGKVFATLDELETRLQKTGPYLFGERLTETDVRLFVTLVRFDVAYHGLFKCNRNCLREMPALHNYMHRIWSLENIANTVYLDHIKAGYYSIKALNPSGLVPAGPAQI